MSTRGTDYAFKKVAQLFSKGCDYLLTKLESFAIILKHNAYGDVAKW